MKNRIFPMIRYSLFAVALLLPSQVGAQVLTGDVLLEILERIVEIDESGGRHGSLTGILSNALMDPETDQASRELVWQRADEVLRDLEYDVRTRQRMVSFLATEPSADTTPGASLSVPRLRGLYASMKGDAAIEVLIVLTAPLAADRSAVVRFLGEVATSQEPGRNPMVGMLAVEGIAKQGSEGIEFLVSALQANRIQGQRARAQAGVMLRAAGVEVPKG